MSTEETYKQKPPVVTEQKTYPTPRRNPMQWSTKRLLAVISALGFYGAAYVDMKFFNGQYIIPHVPTITLMVFAFYFKAKGDENGIS